MQNNRVENPGELPVGKWDEVRNTDSLFKFAILILSDLQRLLLWNSLQICCHI